MPSCRCSSPSSTAWTSILDRPDRSMKESSVAPDRKPERGAAVVETAFITIFLLILVTGIIDVGRAIFTNISIQEAAQEAAVYAAFDESVTVADIAHRAVDSTRSPALTL